MLLFLIWLLMNGWRPVACVISYRPYDYPEISGDLTGEKEMARANGARLLLLASQLESQGIHPRWRCKRPASIFQSFSESLYCKFSEAGCSCVFPDGLNKCPRNTRMATDA